MGRCPTPRKGPALDPRGGPDPLDSHARIRSLVGRFALAFFFFVFLFLLCFFSISAAVAFVVKFGIALRFEIIPAQQKVYQEYYKHTPRYPRAYRALRKAFDEFPTQNVYSSHNHQYARRNAHRSLPPESREHEQCSR